MDLASLDGVLLSRESGDESLSICLYGIYNLSSEPECFKTTLTLHLRTLSECISRHLPGRHTKGGTAAELMGAGSIFLK